MFFKNKRGQVGTDIIGGTLVEIVIGILLVLILVSVGYKFSSFLFDTSIDSGTEKTFNNFIDLVEKIGDGEEKTLPFYIKEGFIFLVYNSEIQKVNKIVRPTECGVESSCVVVCYDDYGYPSNDCLEELKLHYTFKNKFKFEYKGEDVFLKQRELDILYIKREGNKISLLDSGTVKSRDSLEKLLDTPIIEGGKVKIKEAIILGVEGEAYDLPKQYISKYMAENYPNDGWRILVYKDDMKNPKIILNNEGYSPTSNLDWFDENLGEGIVIRLAIEKKE